MKKMSLKKKKLLVGSVLVLPTTFVILVGLYLSEGLVGVVGVLFIVALFTGVLLIADGLSS